jgi:hypothetical protein
MRETRRVAGGSRRVNGLTFGAGVVVIERLAEDVLDRLDLLLGFFHGGADGALALRALLIVGRGWGRDLRSSSGGRFTRLVFELLREVGGRDPHLLEQGDNLLNRIILIVLGVLLLRAQAFA